MSVFDQRDQSFHFHEGPIFTNILLADEINRASPRTQSALLEAMAEGQVTVDGTRYLLESLFFVMATQNPVEFRGTYPLPEAQMDRFALRFGLGYVAPDDEVAILSAQERRHPLDDARRRVSTRRRASRCAAAVSEVRISDELKRYIVDVVARHAPGRGRAARREPARLARAHEGGAGAGAARRRRPSSRPSTCIEIAVPVIAHRMVIDPAGPLLGGDRATDRRGHPQDTAGAGLRPAARPSRTRRLLYRSFRLVHAVDEWIARRFTVAGRLVLGGFARGGHRRHRHQPHRRLPGLRVPRRGARRRARREQHVPGALRGGATAAALRHRGRAPALPRSLSTTARPRCSPASSCASASPIRARRSRSSPRRASPARSARNWFDRKVGYPRWVWLIKQRRGADDRRAAAAGDRAARPRRAVARHRAARRGRLRFAARRRRARPIRSDCSRRA